MNITIIAIALLLINSAILIKKNQNKDALENK